MKVYLCSRVSPDAHKLNNKVTEYLRKLEYTVFTPHEAPYNQVLDGSVSDETVYNLDMSEMLLADVCVIVGRIGVDCAFEAGWFQERGIPTVWYAPTGLRPGIGRHPMLFKILKVIKLEFIKEFLEAVEEMMANEKVAVSK